MKKQFIKKQDIRRDLLNKINKVKKLSIFLTVLTAASIISYILFCMNFTNIMAEYSSGHFAGRGIHPILGLFIGALVIIFFVVFLLDFYYIDLIKATTGRFSIIEEKLCERNTERVFYYRNTKKENLFYFRRRKVSVESEIYSHSSVGDNFYLIVLRTKKAPLLVYNSKYYEIDKF